ncbi:uncharacterized protein EV420DRAFT_1768951 [Desarmillaria tabescens]|uniref:F-box domain-containing protein n=1 Tax=Armillaria tabescens TaxID=1929756 RepID=A0AA39JGZ7_ARMTA|nr:uncharacterized protein EV420DRAFT_1768951 [Desarmillaria tabescens]KAK0441780.1 hypothetical protein EV420DRAFT_1768951 [Desarmillaria tabescens]
MTMQRTATIGDRTGTNTYNVSIIEPEAELHSLIHSLPPEILSEIFLLALPSSYSVLEPLHAGPWLLGRVCRRWQDVAWGYPALWSSFVLIDQEAPHRIQEEIGTRMVQEALQRTRQSKLSMTIWTGHIFSDTIVETLLQHSRQWEDVSFLGPSSSQWTQSLLNSHPIHFPSLRSLSLAYPHSIDDIATTMGVIKDAPNLRCLQLDVRVPNFDLSTVLFPWSCITHLDMTFSKFNWVGLIVRLLRLCPSLEELKEKSMLRSETTTIAPLTLEKLRSLSLGFSHLLLRHLTCPVLEYLTFTMPYINYPSSSLTISQFSARSGSHLQTLDLRLARKALDPDQLFSCVPQLRRLILSMADTENDRDPSRFLRCLDSGDMARGLMLPNMSVFELSANRLFMGDIRLERRDELLVRIIDRRWDVPEDSRVTQLSQVRIRCRNPAHVEAKFKGGQAAPKLGALRALSHIDRLKSCKAEGSDISVIADEEMDGLLEERVLL